MTKRPQAAFDSAGAPKAPAVSGGREPRRPLQSVKGPLDFMGLPPHDQRASAAAIRAYFEQPKG
jgi:hypothetical protein